jgi:ribonuclease D
MSNLLETVVTRASELEECCHHIAAAGRFGFDTEFIGEDSFRPRLCLVQVATAERLYLIDPLAVEDLRPFWELVADPRRVTVVHAGREEIRMCAHHLGRPPANVFDLQVAAGLVGAGYPTGHANLVQQFLKVRLAKGETLTDWSRRPLTKQQVRYAYDDVRYLLPLYDKLSRRLSELNRHEWANEEFAALQHRSIDGDAEREPWRKLRGLSGLERQQLAVVREVFAWREQRATVVNKPVRFILRDDLIVEIARRQPTTEHDLAVIRGVTRHDLSGLFAATVRGTQLAEDQWPELAERDNDPPQVALMSNFLMAALASYCAEQRITPGLAATSQDVKQLIRDFLAKSVTPKETALQRGWRARHILPFLRGLLEGRQAMKIDQPQSAAPFSFFECQ